MLIGAHVSVAAGYEYLVAYAAQVGCECVQIFAKSPRQWRGPAIDPEEAARFARLRTQARIESLFTHTAYLLNLSTDDDILWEKSVDALADELARGAVLKASGVVTHIGNDRTADPSRATRRVSEAILRAFDRAGDVHGTTRLLLENAAGAGSSLGTTPLELGRIIERTTLPPDILGVCLDTCHAHAYGFDLSDQMGWEAMLGTLHREVGLPRLGLVHANDCLFHAGSRRDRHAWIGDGTIGYEGFRAMVCQSSLTGVPVVTEMPGEVPQKDVENLRRLKELRDSCTAS